MKSQPAPDQLLAAISEGDEHAFGIFFRHYYKVLYPRVFRFVKSHADTEEVLQDVFLKFWMNRDKLPEVMHIRSWIFKVTSHECISFLRKNQPVRHLYTGLEQEHEDTVPHTPHDTFTFSEIQQLIRQTVDRMSPQQQLIFRLSRENGLKPREIAAELSLSVSTVKNVLCSVLKEIRTQLHRFDLGFLLFLFFQLPY